jgi:hypothetical protein
MDENNKRRRAKDGRIIENYYHHDYLSNFWWAVGRIKGNKAAIFLSNP